VKGVYSKYMSKFIEYWKSKIIGKNENSPSFRRMLAKKIDRKQLKYVSERIGDEEIVIGHKGYIVCVEDELSISAENGTIFRAKIDTLKMNELLSLEGIILTGNDLSQEGKERCVIAYYTYYRKVD